MASSYRVISDISTLGAQGSTVTAEQLEAQNLDAELLVASGVIEPQTKPAKNQEN